MENILIENEVHKKELNDLMQDIDNELLDEEAIILDLENLLNKLSLSDKEKALQIIQIKYNSSSFYNKGNFCIQDNDLNKDFKMIYKELKEMRNEKQFNLMLKNSQFCQENSIPQIIFNNIAILQKLGRAIFEFVDLILILDRKENITDYGTLKLILPFIYEIDLEAQKKACSIIGSYLTKYLYQMQYLIDLLKEKSKQQYLEFQNEVQQAQLKLPLNNEQQIEKCKEYILLVKLLKLNPLNYQQHLDQYLCDNLKLNQSQLSNKFITQQIECLFFKELNISELFMIIIWYFWTQYVLDIAVINQELLTFDSKQKQVVNDRKHLFYKRFVEKLTKTFKDEICFFYLNHWVFYDPQPENTQSHEKFSIYLNEYQDSLINHQYSIKQFDIAQLKLLQDQQLQDLISNEILQRNNLILWAYDINEFVYKNIKSLILQEQLNNIGNSFQGSEKFFTVNVLILVGEMRNFDQRKTQLLIKLFLATKNLQQADSFLKFDEFINVHKQNKQLVQSIFHLTIKQWKLFSSFYPKNLVLDSLTQIVKNHLQQINSIDSTFLNQLGKIFLIINSKESIYLKCFKILTTQIDPRLLHVLFILNSKFPLLSSVKITLITLNILHDQLSPLYQKYLFETLDQFFPHSCYNFQFIHELRTKNIDLSTILKVVSVNYYKTKGDYQKLIDHCQLIFNYSQQFYQNWLEPFEYFGIFRITPSVLLRNQIILQYPQNMNIKLEQFNQSIIKLDDEEQARLVQDWIQNSQNQEKFLGLIPIFFNLIKRDGNPKQLLKFLNFSNFGQQQRIFNTKALFQILFNNANDELKVILLKFRSKESSIPFIYQELNNKNVQKEEQLFALNHHLFYIFPESYSIMNMTLSKSNRQYGKTQLLNEIFYQIEKFEIGDQNDLNKNTIDIMFDFCFNGTRKFALADQHGQIPLSIFKKILPLFQLLIIQMHTEQELEENYEKIQAIRKELVINPEICFIVRDSQKNSQIEYKNIIDKIQLAAIDIHFIADLNENGLDKQIRQMQIDLASKFLFSIIEQDYKSFVDHHNFISITKNFYPCNSKVIEQVNNDAQIINQIEAELERLLKLEQGFFSPEAFPFRALEYKILNLKLEMEATEFQKVQQQIEDLEKEKQYVKQTKILNLFNQILLSENYYILYLLIADKIRKFNQNSTDQLINENLQIQQQKKKLLDEKEKIIDRNPEEKKENQKILKQLEKSLEKNQKDIQLKNMSVEIFWRESTNQQQYGKEQNCYDSALTLYEMLLKGEPIEFLDGDSLKINYQLLKQIANLFQNKGEERVLIMSVLGPQSAGKSTIYNKMFGCHLWTSVGKCTKGIFLQLLKVSNPEQYNNQIDYILLLDTEGLQSTTKKDPEFDKKIALFMLAISDIILIMVKGDINIQFRSLIEMCVYTLGQLQESFSCKKQLSWCFNQNNDDTQINPFLEQISEIANKMNEINAKSCMKNDLDYNDILAINKENIKVFGLSTEQKVWTQADTQKFAKQWRIKVNTESFSKEVQNFGLNLISNHIKKNQISHEQQQFCTLNKVISLIESTWESIQSLPDLLEFQDLIHHLQNEKMRVEYDAIMDQEALKEQINIKQTIKSQISNQNEVTLKLLDSIAQNTIEEVSNILENTKETLFERLNIFKQEERIQENIFMKYNSRLEQYIKTSISEFKIQILEEIQIKKREFQENQGFAQLDKFILSLGTDLVKLQQYQLDSKMIEDKFNEIWNEIDQELQNQSEKTFEEFQINQYQLMTQIFQQCLIRTEKEKEYLNYILKIAKTNPKENYYQKFELFSFFSQELSKTQFTSLDGCQKAFHYQKTYDQPILKKIENYNVNDLIDINQFFKYKVEWRWADSKDLLNYVKGQMLKDLKRLLKSVNFKDNQIKEFFWILEEFGFRYEEKIWDQLFMAIINSSDDIVIIQKFLEFTQKIEQGNNKKVFFENKTSISQILYFYTELKLTSCIKTFNRIQEVYKFREQLKLQYPLVMEFITVDATEKSVEIQNLLEKGQQQMKSNQTQTAQWFSQIMEDKQCWSKLYFQFYDLIQEKVNDKYPTMQSQDFNGSVQRNIINKSRMQMIMADVQQKIQDFNLYFSNYGIILNSLGERCIQYFSILIIWKFVCFSKWEEIQSQTKLSSIKVSEYQKFEAKIMQNKAELSRLRAKELVVNIKEGFLDKFYERQSISAKQHIDSEWISSQQLVKQLDQECFELINDQIEDPDKTYRYLSDQFSFILEYVQMKIFCIESKIFETNEEELKNDLVIFLKSILENSNNLNDQIKEGIKIKDFFNHQLIGQQNLEFYEQNLYNIVLNCLQGIEVKGDLIESTYQQMFSNGYKTLLNPIVIQESHRSDKKIPDLKHFMQEFCHQLKQIINEIQQNPQLDKARLSISQNIDELQLDMIGCWEKCPMCNRKCDQNDMMHKKHSCQNGHQMRGINGICINGQLSHQFCEEVDDDFKMLGEQQFRAVTQKLRRTQEFPDWQFTCFDENQFKFHKQRLVKIWNAGIGKRFCNTRNIPLQNNIQFSVLPIKSLIIQQKLIHYIIVLDTSGDMRGQNWKNAKEAVLNCLEIIKKNPNARVSIIFFGYWATLEIDCKTADSISENIFNVSKYGFTRFSPPFEKIYSQIKKYENTIFFESIAILFYSDSVAEYPANEMRMLKTIDITLRQIMSFFICTYQQNEEFFEKINGGLEQLNLRKIKLSNNIPARDLQSVWPELISKINKQKK